MLLLEIVGDILPIIVLIALGYFLREKKYIDDGLNKNLSFLVMNIALPASIFMAVVKNLDLSQVGKLKGLLLLGAVVLVILYAVSFVLMKVCRVPRGRRALFINGIVNTNSLFIGMPLNEALLGDQAITFFLVFYLMSLISLWFIGAPLALNDPCTSSDHTAGNFHFHWKQVLQPPLLGALAAIPVLVLGIQLPKPIFATLNYIGNTVTALSLIYIGISLSVSGLSSVRLDRDTVLALAGRFLLSPALTAFVFLLAAQIGYSQPALATRTFIVQNAVPTLAILPILATQGKGDVTYAVNLVTLGTVLFVFVVPVVMVLVS